MQVVIPLTAMILAAAAAFSVQAVRQTVPGVVVCGGVGEDERESLMARSEGANLALEFFVAGRGNYVADVDVTVIPEADPPSALAIDADGPICLLTVAPGRYRVEARYEGSIQRATARVPASSSAPTRVAIAFPEQHESAR
jgi:hypothetical protein